MVPLKTYGRIRPMTGQDLRLRGHPGLVEVPFGLSLHQVLEQFGGGMAPGSRFKAVQVGGPLGSLFPASQTDIPICYDAFAKAGAVLGHGGIVVYDHETDMVDLARHFMAFTADESCGKCTPCRIGSVRGREILERIQAGSGTIEDLALLHDLGDTMKTVEEVLAKRYEASAGKARVAKDLVDMDTVREKESERKALEQTALAEFLASQGIQAPAAAEAPAPAKEIGPSQGK